MTTPTLPRARELVRMAGFAPGVHSEVLVDERAEYDTEHLIEDARLTELRHAPVADELHKWMWWWGSADGLSPEQATPDLVEDLVAPVDRFSRHDEETERPEHTDRLVVISTSEDGPRSWVETGRALSRLWLEATRLGLGVIPATQVIEVHETRLHLRDVVLHSRLHPQAVVRVGWQEITGPPPPRQRRDVDQTLRSTDPA
ncbi:MAG: nitroreductase family protein [Nocardioidaceae bacterium]